MPCIDMQGIVTDIIPFSVNDGPGIRTSVFFKGCPLRCRWCHNPETQRPSPQAMVIASRCVHCGACAVCPAGARGKHGELDSSRCTGCGMCAAICPAEACRISGKAMTPEEVLARILPDRPFFRKRGGVTLTGGEPMEQPAFAAALAGMLHREGIHTVVETCGYASGEAFREILPYTGLFLFDWKITDPAAHRAWTGRDNRLIRENLELLNREGAEIILRCPVIPGVNDTPEHFRGIAELTNEYPRIRQVDLLPYHALGNSKRCQLGLPKDGFEVPDDQAAARWQQELGRICRVPVCR